MNNNITTIDVKDFKTEYENIISEQINRIKNAYITAMKSIVPQYHKITFKEIECKLEKLFKLVDINLNLSIYEIIYDKIDTKLNGYKNIQRREDEKEIENLIYKTLEEVEEIEKIIYAHVLVIEENIKNLLKEVSACPYRESYKKEQYAIMYQDNIKKLFLWLFIDVLEIPNNYHLFQTKLKRDAVFEVKRSLNIENNIIQFKYIFIECKNFDKPTYMNLMQIVAYTLLIKKDIPGVFNPLCLLISRKNPDKKNVIYTLREQLIRQDISLWIIFLDDNDIKEMVQNKLNREDPFIIINNKIKNLTGLSAVLNES